MLDQPDHVIAEIAEEPRGGLRQIVGQVDPAFGDQRAQAVQRIAVQRLEGVGIEAGLPVQPPTLCPWHCQIRSGFMPMIE